MIILLISGTQRKPNKSDFDFLISELEKFRDALAYTLMLAGKHGFDVKEMVLEKIRKNNEKYPVDKSKGSARKYNEL